MRSASVLLILVAMVTMVTASNNDKVYYNLEDAPALFEQFIKDYNRHYKDIEDKNVHFQAFVASLAEINRQNYDSPYTTFGINEFADYTKEQMKHMYGLRPVHVNNK